LLKEKDETDRVYRQYPTHKTVFALPYCPYTEDNKYVKLETI